MNVAELIRQLQERNVPPDTPVVIWMPCQRIDLERVFGSLSHEGELLIEGNVRPGSTLDDITMGR